MFVFFFLDFVHFVFVSVDEDFYLFFFFCLIISTVVWLLQFLAISVRNHLKNIIRLRLAFTLTCMSVYIAVASLTVQIIFFSVLFFHFCHTVDCNCADTNFVTQNIHYSNVRLAARLLFLLVTCFMCRISFFCCCRCCWCCCCYLLFFFHLYFTRAHFFIPRWWFHYKYQLQCNWRFNIFDKKSHFINAPHFYL